MNSHNPRPATSASATPTLIPAIAAPERPLESFPLELATAIIVGVGVGVSIDDAVGLPGGFEVAALRVSELEAVTVLEIVDVTVEEGTRRDVEVRVRVPRGGFSAAAS